MLEHQMKIILTSDKHQRKGWALFEEMNMRWEDKYGFKVSSKLILSLKSSLAVVIVIVIVILYDNTVASLSYVITKECYTKVTNSGYNSYCPICHREQRPKNIKTLQDIVLLRIQYLPRISHEMASMSGYWNQVLENMLVKQGKCDCCLGCLKHWWQYINLGERSKKTTKIWTHVQIIGR